MLMYLAHQDLGPRGCKKIDELPGSGGEDGPMQGRETDESPAGDAAGGAGTNAKGTGGDSPVESTFTASCGQAAVNSGRRSYRRRPRVAAIFAGCHAAGQSGRIP